MDELGVPNLLIEIPLSDHVLDLELGFNSIGGQPSLYAGERFIAAQLWDHNNNIANNEGGIFLYCIHKLMFHICTSVNISFEGYFNTLRNNYSQCY